MRNSVLSFSFRSLDLPVCQTILTFCKSLKSQIQFKIKLPETCEKACWWQFGWYYWQCAARFPSSSYTTAAASVHFDSNILFLLFRSSWKRDLEERVISLLKIGTKIANPQHWRGVEVLKSTLLFHIAPIQTCCSKCFTKLRQNKGDQTAKEEQKIKLHKVMQ